MLSQISSLCIAAGEPKYTVSLDGLNTVYYTPSLCSKDVTQSLPASDELILALKLGNGATVFGFQVAIKDQLNSDQQGAHISVFLIISVFLRVVHPCSNILLVKLIHFTACNLC